MSNEKEFQLMFAHAVQSKSQVDFSDLIEPVGSLKVHEALSVYTNDYYARLTEALGKHFESVWSVIGDDAFYEVCEAYIKHNPSESDDLGDYGENFSKFLGSSSLADDFPFIKELAEFENSFWETFHLPKDEQIFSLSTMSQEELLRTPFKLRPSVSFHQWDYRLYDLWKLRSEVIEELSFELVEPQNVVLFKNDYQVKGHSLGYASFSLLRGFKEKNTFENLFNEIDISEEEVLSLFKFLGEFHLLIPQK